MGLSNSNLQALKNFPPNSLSGAPLVFLEFLKYETEDIQHEKILSKNVILDRFIQTAEKSTRFSGKISKKEIEQEFNEFVNVLDRILIVKDEDEVISEIDWQSLISICDLFRLIEKSDERKIRWAIFYLFKQGKLTISLDDIANSLKDFKISKLDKKIKKIICTEANTGLIASFDGKQIVISHELDDKLVDHYLADAIEEPARRSKGELEQAILKLLDEGSYSNQEISTILNIDEAMVSRILSRLRKSNKIVLSSFGERGSRNFTTNCNNCPFGTTKTACRKDAISYLITTFKEDYKMDFAIKDFDDIEANQALLRIKRIFMLSRKNKNVKLEQNMNENLGKILSVIVEKSLSIISASKSPQISDVKVDIAPNLNNLPVLYQLGLREGAQRGVHLVDEILRLATESIKDKDRIKVKNQAISEINKFLKNIGIT